MKTLVLAHEQDFSAAGIAPAPFTLGLIGLSAAPACGAERMVCVDGEAYRTPRSSTDIAAALALVRHVGPELVLAPQSSRMARALPAVAAMVNGAIDTHVVAFQEGKARRWYYRQRMEGGFTRGQRPWFLLVEPEPVSFAGEAPAEPIECAAPEIKTTHAGYVSPEAGEQTLRPDAPLLFVAGAGWTKKQKDGATHTGEAGELILEFVRKSKCSLGSSKSLVDLSGEGEAVLPFLTHLHQVGQTGSTPRHRKGLATCCHGEEPHVVGWRFINERRAINLDANCGWARGKADVLYVADAFAVMAEVNRLLD